MINNFITFSLQQRAVTIMLMVAVVALGVFSIFTLSTDAFPDVSNVQVQIITEPESMATEEVESLVTVPIEYALNGLPFIEKVRSSSEFGLSMVTAIFDDSCDVYLARQLVQQRLSTLKLPEDVPTPYLAPVLSTFSQVFMYQITSTNHNLIDLRTIQDWDIAKRLLSVPGVGNVVTYGGWIKQYKVLVTPTSLKSHGVTLKELSEAIAAGNKNAGANFIEQAEEEVVIRGIGRVENKEDIANIVIKEFDGTPLTVGRVAKVTIGPAFRRGSASVDGKGEAVIGIVFSRKGANTKEVVDRVEKKLAEIQKTMPDGISLTPFYNQKELVDKTTDTVQEILFFSGALVIIVLAAVLMDIPAALIVCLIIPLSLIFSFVLMKFTGLSLNLMTLGAVDFGVVVDAGVVMVENIFRKLSSHKENGQPFDRLKIITAAAQEVGRPICFAMCIIVAVYLPLFTLEGIEGKMFEPLALTFVYALAGALIVSLTIIPVACYFVFRKPVVERHNPVVEFLKRSYVPCLGWCIRHPKPLIVSAFCGLVGALGLVPLLGSEFIPSLDEGSLWLRLRMPASIAHRKTEEVVAEFEKIICALPEVTIAATRVGRSGMGSDVEGVDAADMFIGLKPRKEWSDPSKERLVERMSKAVSVMPGVMYSFSQPIEDMIADLITGIKADVGIKIFGPELEKIEELTDEVRRCVSNVPGAADISREPILGLPELKVKLNRAMLARYGLRSSDVFDDMQTALAGKVVSEVVEGNKRFGILLQYPHEHRETAEQIKRLHIEPQDGAHVPLKAIADINVEKGAVLINREDGQRRAAVMVNVRGRDLGSFVIEAQKTVAAQVKLPPGYWISWGGQFENQQRAMMRLAVVVPIVLFLIFILLFFTFNSVKNAALIMLNVPFSMIGGVVALWLTHQPLSVPAVIGFIALFGVAVQNGVILVSYIRQVQSETSLSLEKAIIEGASVRLRPVLMTALVAITGLVPKLFSDGTGAEIQRPLATVVFGGLISATVLTLFVIPSMYKLINRGKEQLLLKSLASAMEETTHSQARLPDHSEPRSDEQSDKV